jgi:hypothetical protein
MHETTQENCAAKTFIFTTTPRRFPKVLAFTAIRVCSQTTNICGIKLIVRAIINGKLLFLKKGNLSDNQICMSSIE